MSSTSARPTLFSALASALADAMPRTRCHTSVMAILGQEAKATGNGVTMDATLKSHGFEIRFPPGLSAAQRMRLRLYIQAIRSDMIVNCLPGAPRSSHYSRVYDFTSTSPLPEFQKKRQL